jgi:leucyl-tRNA synthetase/REP element-mobilizing transposase RayT
MTDPQEKSSRPGAAAETGRRDDIPPHRYTAALANQIEAYWQGLWQREGAFRQPNPGEPGFDASRPKFYCLDMFPYPSGAGLHVGHPEGYTATDILCRYKRMRGFNVLHPMGWDAFGLPAEQYAIQTGVHPSVTTRAAIDNFRRQLQRFGFSYDWEREFGTIDEGYYRWTQWIFLKIYDSWFDVAANRARPIAELIAELESGDLRIGPDGELSQIGAPARALEGLSGEPGALRQWHELSAGEQRDFIDSQRLAYIGEQVVNWCPKLGTALANEEVIDGRSERGGHPVLRKPLRQWMFRITAYAERLLAGLDELDWPQSTRAQQAEWIGRSQGAEVDFALGSPSLRGGRNRDEPTNSKAAPLETIVAAFGTQGLDALRPTGFVGRDPYPPGTYGSVRDLVRTKRNLPHLSLPDATYFVTWRTSGETTLDDDECDIVLQALLHFDDDRCRVFAANVMNTHVHWIVRPYDGHTLDELVKSVKRLTAQRINKARGSRSDSHGRVWDPERFDHIVRDGQDFNALVKYVIENPTEAGVVSDPADYRWTFVHRDAAGPDATGSSPPAEREATQPFLRVFTTRPDTIFGATYMVVAPEHPIIDDVLAAPREETPVDELRAYVEQARNRSDVERQESKKKTGCFTGLYAVNPATRERIPVWCADYVLMGYGFGAIMAVPAHDERDFEFAEAYGLPIRDVVYTRQQLAIAFIARHASTSERDDTRWIATLADFMGITTSRDMGPQRFGEALNILRERRLGRPVGATIQLTPARTASLGEAGSVGERRGSTRMTWMQTVADLGMSTWGETIAQLDEMRLSERAGQSNPAPGYGTNSANDQVSLDGLPTAEAKDRIIGWLEQTGLGRRKVNYRLRDWLFSRQRYWGEPFPIVWDEDGNHHPVDESALPVKLPELADYAPIESEDPLPLLAKATAWVNTNAGEAGAGRLPPDTPVRRETNTMPGWAGSCWYCLRFCDPGNDERFVGEEAERYWMGGGRNDATTQPGDERGTSGGAGGVDLYIGGAEHAVLHLLYARFWHMALYDLGYVSTPEPFHKLFHQGLITSHAFQRADKTLVAIDEVEEAGDGRFIERESGAEVTQITAKMSKSLKNVVNPDDIITEYGADTFRLYEMYLGPLEASKPWNTRDISGLFRFLQRTWRLLVDEGTGEIKLASVHNAELEKKLHRTIAKVGADIEHLGFNTAIAAMIEFVNAATAAAATATGEAGPALTRDQAERFCLTLSPLAPHMAEEIGQKLGRDAMLTTTGAWPSFDEAMLRDDEVEIAVQLMGKVKARIMAPADADEDALREFALSHADVAPLIAGKTVRKVIAVPGRLVNIVAS